MTMTDLIDELRSTIATQERVITTLRGHLARAVKEREAMASERANLYLKLGSMDARLAQVMKEFETLVNDLNRAALIGA